MLTYIYSSQCWGQWENKNSNNNNRNAVSGELARRNTATTTAQSTAQSTKHSTGRDHLCKLRIPSVATITKMFNAIKSVKYKGLRIYFPQSTLPPGWNKHDVSTFYWHFFLRERMVTVTSCFLPVRLRLVACLLAAGLASLKIPAHSAHSYDGQCSMSKHISTSALLKGKNASGAKAKSYILLLFLTSIIIVIRARCMMRGSATDASGRPGK